MGSGSRVKGDREEIKVHESLEENLHAVECDALAAYRLGNRHEDYSDWQQALVCYRYALSQFEKHPVISCGEESSMQRREHAVLHNAIARTYIMLGQNGDAAKHVRKSKIAAGGHVPNLEAKFLLGELYLRNARYEEAVGAYMSMLEMRLVQGREAVLVKCAIERIEYVNQLRSGLFAVA